MRKIILVTTLLVVFALVVAPALAAKPQAQHKAVWRGSGIDETGARVQFSGSVVGSDLGGFLSWNGKATYVDRDRDIVADIRLDESASTDLTLSDLAAGYVDFRGHADVTVGDVTYQDCDVGIYVNEVTSTYSMFINCMSNDWDLSQTFAGDDFKGTIRIT